jgi:hypothetical protein
MNIRFALAGLATLGSMVLADTADAQRPVSVYGGGARPVRPCRGPCYWNVDKQPKNSAILKQRRVSPTKLPPSVTNR